MHPLTAQELLVVWERGLKQQPIKRALTLLAAASRETPIEVLAEFSVGQRDFHLLQLREWTFGRHVVSQATCPNCGERLEMNFDLSDIRADQALEGSDAEAGALSSSVADFDVRFRLPNSLDLAAVTAIDDVAAARETLLHRCLLEIRHGDAEITADELPAEVMEVVVEQMAQADPQADVKLVLTCPACDHQWKAIFDILSFYWSEIDNWAHRMLRDIHVLARAYGWREADILNLSPWRRQYYLEMINA